MIRGSCEGTRLFACLQPRLLASLEKILAAGKKKLVLEHLIVSRMNMEERETEEIENILQFGAKQLFEEGDGESANDIRYSDVDVRSAV